MPDEKAKKAADDALQRLMAELEKGHSEALKNYLTAMGRFHRYSWNNVLLIHSQKPEATRVAGFHTWHDLGRSVKKGEKGIMILAPVIVKHKDAPTPAEDKPIKPEESRRLAGFRTAYVFDVSQTDGKPLPEFAKATGDPQQYTDKLKALVARQGIELTYDDSIKPAQGVSTGGKIRLVPGLSRAEEFSVLTHELAHEMMHHRKDVERQATVVKETQAEAVAYVVCRGVGLQTNTAASDYIKLYNGDKKTLADSLADIQETSSKILDELVPEQQRAIQRDKVPTSTQSMPASQAHPVQAPPVATPADPSDTMVWDR